MNHYYFPIWQVRLWLLDKAPQQTPKLNLTLALMGLISRASGDMEEAVVVLSVLYFGLKQCGRRKHGTDRF